MVLEEVLAKWNRRRMSGQGILVPVMGELPPTTSPNPATTGPGGLLNGPKPRNVPMEGHGPGEVPSRTKPSGKPNPNANPTGPRAERSKNDKDLNNKRAADGEDRAADILAQEGYDVKQKRPVTKDGKKQKTADYEIEGQDMDCITPAEGTSSKNIRYRIIEKVRDKQTKRIVLNLERWKGDVNELKQLIKNENMEGLEEVIIINSTGKPQHIFP